MTEIKFYEENHKILGFSINGHTKFGRFGEDIVCASISATTLMTINALLEVLKIKELQYSIKSGCVSVDLRNLGEKNDTYVQNFLLALKSILKQIAKEYPKKVKFEIRRYGL